MAGAGTLFLTLTAATTTLAILAQPPTPPTETFSIALENALIGVHAPLLFLVAGALASPAKGAPFLSAPGLRVSTGT